MNPMRKFIPLKERLGTKNGTIRYIIRGDPNSYPRGYLTGPDSPNFVFPESSESVLTLSKTKRRKAEERIGVYKDELLARVALLNR